MQDTDIPTKFPIPFANAAGGSYIRTIPKNSQIGTQDGAASLTDGFPPLNFVPPGSGGVPPFGEDFNGLLFQITAWVRWITAGGAPVPYDATFQTDIGGYPMGAVVASLSTFGSYWLSTADNNTTNPDSGGAGWVAWSPGSSEYCVDTGAANALVITPVSVLASYKDGVTYLVDPAHANTTAATINVSGLGAKPIVHVDGSALLAGEIQAGQLMRLAYLGTHFQWLNAPFATTQAPLSGNTFPASTAYADAAAAAIDGFAGNLIGLITSNTPSFTTTRITIAAGSCRDSTNSLNMVLAAPITKDLTAAWAVGNSNGGRDTGSLSNGQTWFVYLIFKPVGAVTDALFSQSPTAPTLPTGYTYFRRVGSILLDAATTTIRQFIQIGDWFEYVTRSADYASTSNGSGVPTYRPISVPLGVKVRARFYFQSTGTANTTAYLSGVYDPDLGVPPNFGVPTQWAQIRRGSILDSTSAALSYGTTTFEQWTDSSAHIYTFSSDTNDVIALGVMAYQDITLNRFF